MMIDPTGHLPFLVSLGISIVLSLLPVFIVDVVDDGRINTHVRVYAGAFMSGLISSVMGGLLTLVEYQH